ncbi:sodium channel protein Nach-like [Maniola hyperantus]|uniref:sodium channel protein Nach-like n=1 Tax=Aphantopus hyperantus TaxID=2795564 RepID=UPI003747954C
MPSKFSCIGHVKDYCATCTFAGVRFIADDTKHWIERLLWAVLVILSWFGSALLISSAWEAFVKSPISFGVETTYLDWETRVPAVAVCNVVAKTNKYQIYNIGNKIFNSFKFDDEIKEIIYFRGRAFNLVKNCLPENRDPQCPLSNYSYYASFILSPCSEVLANCSYNNKKFDCCEYFQPIETDIGVCYIINSIQTKNPKTYPMVNNVIHKRGVLRFKLLRASMIYTLGEDEIPNIATLLSSTLQVLLGKLYRREVIVKNIENHPLVEQTTLEQRVCRFHHENEDGLYPQYSYSACIIRCRKLAQLKTCQCNDHFMVGATEEEHCNITGMACLHDNFAYLTALKPPWAQRPGLVCDCLPSCNETEINVIEDMALPLHTENSKEAHVEIILAYLPTERFKRNVVRSRLDLVVSLGGTAGLFVGASLLSFVELIFFFTVRLINNVWIEKRKQNNNVHRNRY